MEIQTSARSLSYVAHKYKYGTIVLFYSRIQKNSECDTSANYAFLFCLKENIMLETFF